MGSCLHVLVIAPLYGFSGASSRLRWGKNGVTSKGILSALDIRSTGLLLSNSIRSDHGSTTIRDPIGRAEI